MDLHASYTVLLFSYEEKVECKCELLTLLAIELETYLNKVNKAK